MKRLTDPSKWYIGATGYTKPEEVDRITRFYPADDSCPNIMFGFLMNWHTLMGRESPVNPKRYPARETMASLFSAHPRALNLIHYQPDGRDELWYQLAALRGLYSEEYERGRLLDGFQLNAVWPDPKQLELFNKLTQNSVTLVLQIGPHAMGILRSSLVDPMEMLGEYNDLVNYILIDESAGAGVPIDINKTSAFLDEIAERGFSFDVGIAGNLSADSLDGALPLIREYRVNIDAESALRDENDDMDLGKTEEYFQKAFEFCASQR